MTEGKTSQQRFEISAKMEAHYEQKFREFGTTPQGVDWGSDDQDHALRLDRMLAVAVGPLHGASILDVGCGYGSLLELLKERETPIEYTGIDLCQPMIDAALVRHPEATWLCGDVLELDGRSFDYVVCNGIFTQKLTASNREMDTFLALVLNKMFELCRIGICFNVMSTHVNFTAPNLYYRNPAELVAWIMTSLSPKVRMDHSYPLFEYCLYVYKEDAQGVAYQSHRRIV